MRKTVIAKKDKQNLRRIFSLEQGMRANNERAHTLVRNQGMTMRKTVIAKKDKQNLRRIFSLEQGMRANNEGAHTLVRDRADDDAQHSYCQKRQAKFAQDFWLRARHASEQ